MIPTWLTIELNRHSEPLLYWALCASLAALAGIFLLLLLFFLTLLLYYTESAFLLAFLTAFALVGSVGTILSLFVLLCYLLHREKRAADGRGRRVMSVEDPVSYKKPLPLNRFHFAFNRLVNLDTLVPLLSQQGVLSTHELQDLISPQLSRSERVSYLVTVVDRKGLKGMEGLIMALRREEEHIGHEELASTLEKEYPW